MKVRGAPEAIKRGRDGSPRVHAAACRRTPLPPEASLHAASGCSRSAVTVPLGFLAISRPRGPLRGALGTQAGVSVGISARAHTRTRLSWCAGRPALVCAAPIPLGQVRSTSARRWCATAPANARSRGRWPSRHPRMRAACRPTAPHPRSLHRSPAWLPSSRSKLARRTHAKGVRTHSNKAFIAAERYRKCGVPCSRLHRAPAQAAPVECAPTPAPSRTPTAADCTAHCYERRHGRGADAG